MMPEPDQNTKHLFILSRGRSGTSLIQTMLDAHPNIQAADECRYIQYIYYFQKYISKENFKYFLKNIPETLDINEEKLNDQTGDNQAEIQSLAKSVGLAWNSPFEKNDIRLLTDKNPRYSFFIPQLKKLFPDAVFLHIARDPRAVVNSFLQAKGMHFEKKNVYYQAWRYRFYHTSIFKAKKKFPENWIELNFEEFLSDTEGATDKILRPFGLHFDKEMSNFSLKTSERKEKHYKEKHQSLTKPLTPSKADEWEGKLDKEQIRLIANITYRTAQLLGYNIEKQSLCPGMFVQKIFWWFPAIIPLYAKRLFFGKKNIMRFFYKVSGNINYQGFSRSDA